MIKAVLLLFYSFNKAMYEIESFPHTCLSDGAEMPPTKGIVGCLVRAEERVLSTSHINQVMAAPIGGAVGNGIPPYPFTYSYQETTYFRSC